MIDDLIFDLDYWHKRRGDREFCEPFGGRDIRWICRQDLWGALLQVYAENGLLGLRHRLEVSIHDGVNHQGHLASSGFVRDFMVGALLGAPKNEPLREV